mmetsp:Transcript_46762/g.112342  ORF Transcript_46762/g.112342 Transcript_46762/m.112342 type:complete len:201 (-) Transcript_46762:700-1302(-)
MSSGTTMSNGSLDHASSSNDTSRARDRDGSTMTSTVLPPSLFSSFALSPVSSSSIECKEHESLFPTEDEGPALFSSKEDNSLSSVSAHSSSLSCEPNVSPPNFCSSSTCAVTIALCASIFIVNRLSMFSVSLAMILIPEFTRSSLESNTLILESKGRTFKSVLTLTVSVAAAMSWIHCSTFRCNALISAHCVSAAATIHA